MKHLSTITAATLALGINAGVLAKDPVTSVTANVQELASAARCFDDGDIGVYLECKAESGASQADLRNIIETYFPLDSLSINNDMRERYIQDLLKNLGSGSFYKTNASIVSLQTLTQGN